MSANSTKTESKRRRTGWAKLQKITDQEIDYSDIPPTDAKFWEKAQVVFPPVKTHVSLRLDEDIVEWFKRQGAGYQTKINTVLRSYIQAHRGGSRNSDSVISGSLASPTPPEGGDTKERGDEENETESRGDL